MFLKEITLQTKQSFSSRFRHMLPVVIDVETSGLNPATDALLELAVVTLKINALGTLLPAETFSYHIEPFENAHINPEALEVNKIDLSTPLRYAIPEQHALHNVFEKLRRIIAQHQCQRAIWVGHNVWFDLAFIQAAVKRCQIKSVPFHGFTTIDTASLSAVLLGETVLARAIRAAGISFDVNLAHSAIYDACKTAELFCWLANSSYIR
jgi:ribonuclease T